MKKLILILLLIPLFSFSQQSGKFRILTVTELLHSTLTSADNITVRDTLNASVGAFTGNISLADKLIVNGGSYDTDLTYGSTGGVNIWDGLFLMKMDASSIQATEETANSVLYLNKLGGDVRIGDPTASNLIVSGSTTSTKFTSNVATGTQPYAGVSTTLNDSLNADLLDGYHASELIFAPSTTNTYIPYDSLGTYVNSPMVTDGTNVGIGTNPSQKLDVAGNININTNGTDMLMSSYKGANSDGDNSFIGGGGQSSIGEVGVTYKGSYNSAHGVYALYANTTGYSNSAQGYKALYANTTGYNNSAQGYKALLSNTTGNQNSAQGYQALLSNTTGYNNSAQGYNAGTYIANGISWNQDGDNSIFIGTSSKANATSETNQIVIGCDATGKGNNTTVIGNASVTDIYMSEDAGAIVHAGQYKLSALNTAPASAAATGTLGEIRVTATYIYICTATDTWVRVAVATW